MASRPSLKPPKFRVSPLRTREKVRSLNVRELLPADGTLMAEIAQDDVVLRQVRELLPTFGGVIFVGPPGTGKSWYAAQIGALLADGDASRVRFVQFHPSYQYEDFVEGFVPRTDGRGFEMRPKVLLELILLAEKDPRNHVLVIDEISRSDPARVFGEGLTYIERTKRGLRFRLASGNETAIPENLLILATMNPFDRGVDDVDAAFERRFARIVMDPDVAALRSLLVRAGMNSAAAIDAVAAFLQMTLRVSEDNPYGQIGHAYFRGVATAADLERLWNHQLRFVLKKAYQLRGDDFDEISAAFDACLAAVREAAASPETQAGAPAEE